MRTPLCGELGPEQMEPITPFWYQLGLLEDTYTHSNMRTPVRGEPGPEQMKGTSHALYLAWACREQAAANVSLSFSTSNISGMNTMLTLLPRSQMFDIWFFYINFTTGIIQKIKKIKYNVIYYHYRKH
jgi:hypothetical protein